MVRGKLVGTEKNHLKTLKTYSTEIEKQMQEMQGRLSEKDKRLYAGVEALKGL